MVFIHKILLGYQKTWRQMSVLFKKQPLTRDAVAFHVDVKGDKCIERKGTEESVQQESNNSSLSIQGPELSGSGLPVMQNRRGYCSCCHVHYNNLEQHVYSPQHRHFATYCRNRMGTTSLMERFLQDVLQHHPYRYHDNRPTYDDMPFTSSQLPRDEAVLSLDLAEKGKTASRGEEPSTDSGFTAESACLISQRSHEELKNAFVSVAPIQRLESGQEHTIGTSPPKLNISCSTINLIPMENAVTETSNHKGPNITVSLFPHPLPVSHLSSTPYVLGKNTKYSVIPESVSSNQHEQNKHDICNQDRLPNPHLRSLLQPDRSRTIPFSRKSSAYNQGYSIISGQLFCKEDGLQSQDETLISDFSLRNTSNLVGTSSSLTFQASSQLSDTKKSKISRGAETSVDEVIEEVILKYCHETAPKEFICGDEDTNSSVNILSLLDKSSVHGSDLSFDCDAAVQSRALLPKASVKNLEPLKARQVTLQDDNYGLQLRSILRKDSVQQRSETKKDKPVHDKEPVLPALPHVPPSFVGKTWSQIMHEDDMKIEALVRDFREGHFRCHFDTESLAHCAKRRLRKQKMKEEERLHLVASKKTKATSAKGLPEFTDGSDFSHLSAISETQHIPEIQNVPETLKRPRKRTWRLASRCQVVKVSHGTQTSLVHYPVVKQKIIRKKSEPPDQKAGFLWPGNEQTPSMKTRLCALKLPESYTKIMSPVQPQTVVYVLSCPERKQFKSKAEDFSKIRRSHHSTDSKESVRYKYKQSCIKYYDPLTNRILKTPPKSLVGEKARKPPHVRQLFRSLNLDANNKKQAGEQYDCVTPKSFSSKDLHSLSVKEKDMNSSHDAEASSLSLDRPECLVCNSSEKSYKHLVLSPLNSHQLPQEDDFSLIPFNKKQPSIADCLGRDNPKTGWQRKKGSSRESGFPKKALAPAFGRHNLIKRGNKIQPHRTTVRQKEGRISTCSRKSCGLSAPSHQKMTATVGKHLKKAKTDAKILKVARKPKRTFLNSAAIIGISEKRQRTTAKTSSRVKKWEATGEKSLLHTVK